jgi:hypothetical protein
MHCIGKFFQNPFLCIVLDCNIDAGDLEFDELDSPKRFLVKLQNTYLGVELEKKANGASNKQGVITIPQASSFLQRIRFAQHDLSSVWIVLDVMPNTVLKKKVLPNCSGLKKIILDVKLMPTFSLPMVLGESKRKAGYNANGTPAADMKYGDYDKKQIVAIRDIFWIDDVLVDLDTVSADVLFYHFQKWQRIYLLLVNWNKIL